MKYVFTNYVLTDYGESDELTSDNIGNYDYDRAKHIREKDEKQLKDTEYSWPQFKDRLIDETKDKSYEDVLEIGCGTGRFLSFPHTKNMHALDLSMDMLRHVPNHAHVDSKNYDDLFLIRDDINCFVENPDYQNKFDFIYSVHCTCISITIDWFRLILKVINLLKSEGRCSFLLNIKELISHAIEDNRVGPIPSRSDSGTEDLVVGKLNTILKGLMADNKICNVKSIDYNRKWDIEVSFTKC